MRARHHNHDSGEGVSVAALMAAANIIVTRENSGGDAMQDFCLYMTYLRAYSFSFLSACLYDDNSRSAP